MCFVNFGFNDAIINKKKVTQLDYSTVFWGEYNIGLISLYYSIFFKSICRVIF